MLQALEFPAASDPLILQRAVQLAIELKQHVFDTLYHAVALETPNAILVTADDRYLRAARRNGHIMDLRDWE
jgi:predicted nucleic acid-binding protein